MFLFYKSYFNKWKKLSIGIDFGIGIDQNSWYRTGIVLKPKKLVSPITSSAKSHERTMTLVCPAHISNGGQLFRPFGAHQHSVANGGAAHPDIYMKTS